MAKVYIDWPPLPDKPSYVFPREFVEERNIDLTPREFDESIAKFRAVIGAGEKAGEALQRSMCWMCCGAYWGANNLACMGYWCICCPCAGVPCTISHWVGLTCDCVQICFTTKRVKDKLKEQYEIGEKIEQWCRETSDLHRRKGLRWSLKHEEFQRPVGFAGGGIRRSVVSMRYWLQIDFVGVPTQDELDALGLGQPGEEAIREQPAVVRMRLDMLRRDDSREEESLSLKTLVPEGGDFFSRAHMQFVRDEVEREARLRESGNQLNKPHSLRRAPASNNGGGGGGGGVQGHESCALAEGAVVSSCSGKGKEKIREAVTDLESKLAGVESVPAGTAVQNDSCSPEDDAVDTGVVKAVAEAERGVGSISLPEKIECSVVAEESRQLEDEDSPISAEEIWVELAGVLEASENDSSSCLCSGHSDTASNSEEIASGSGDNSLDDVKLNGV